MAPEWRAFFGLHVHDRRRHSRFSIDLKCLVSGPWRKPLADTYRNPRSRAAIRLLAIVALVLSINLKNQVVRVIGGVVASLRRPSDKRPGLRAVAGKRIAPG